APSAGFAQHGGVRAAPAPTVPPEAKQYDYLIGQWELIVKLPPQGLAQRIHGVPKLAGTWKAWRAFDGFGIEDELSITDAAGNPVGLNHSLRIYDRAARQWSITGLDVYRAKFLPATAEWKDGAMNQTSRGVDPDGKPYLSRTRIYDITPTTFRFKQDRSYDEGKSWTEGTLVIEARRVSAVAPR
ncbi:MAG TPA: hypothetical protein VFU23_04530, partial [Gemmatimonadales bacterium]|nr:hypothetical protein [Gemmatimonadales bacterium]